MKLLIAKYCKIFDRLPLAAKSITLAVILGLTFIIWYYGFWHDLQNSLTTAATKIKDLEQSIPKLEKQLKVVTKEIKGKLDILDTGDTNGSFRMLSPRQASMALHDLLKNTGGLELLQLENTPVKEVMLSQFNLKVFEHGLIIKFQGDYFSTMRYLQSVEKLKWKIFWDELEYKVTRYPTAEITLYLHTISNTGDWVHV